MRERQRAATRARSRAEHGGGISLYLPMIGSPVAEFLHATHHDISAWGIASVCASGAAHTVLTLCASDETDLIRRRAMLPRERALNGRLPPVTAEMTPICRTHRPATPHILVPAGREAHAGLAVPLLVDLRDLRSGRPCRPQRAQPVPRRRAT